MFFGFNSIYHRNVFIPFSHFPKRPRIATQSLKGGACGALAGQSRPCNHIYITWKSQPRLSRLNGMGGELRSDESHADFG